jgi:hypothetical protein
MTVSCSSGKDAALLLDDVPEVLAMARAVTTEISGLEVDPRRLTEAYAKEICRFAAGEIHPVAALIGGVVAQEAVKVGERERGRNE